MPCSLMTGIPDSLIFQVLNGASDSAFLLYRFLFCFIHFSWHGGWLKLMVNVPLNHSRWCLGPRGVQHMI
jgi:hypothetical protein